MKDYVYPPVIRLALTLFRGLGFQQIDAGHLYRLSD